MATSKLTYIPSVRYEWISGISYQEAWDYQTALHKALVQRKLAQRDLAPQEREAPVHHLVFCEHQPVYTLGKSGSIDHLLLDDAGLAVADVEYYKINRGGDITYHGPGQITGYPIFDLDDFFTDVHKYVRYLEQIVIDVVAQYGLVGERLEGYTGVWLPPDTRGRPWRKICAIGVHLSRWVTMHGFAFNVNTDLAYFTHIVPCGIDAVDKAVTSLSAELGRPVDLDEVAERLRAAFSTRFDFTYLINV